MAPASSLRDDGLVVGLVNDLTLTFDRGRPVPAETSAELRLRCAGTVHDDVSPDDLEDLRQLAALLRPVFGRGTEADADHAAAIANRLLGRYACEPRLIDVPGRGWTLELRSADTAGTVARIGAHVATTLAMLIDSQRIDRLRFCAAGRCDRVFLDLSRKRHQRYCCERCMSRSKVAAWRARKSTVDSR